MEETLIHYIKTNLLDSNFDDDLLPEDDLLNEGLVDSLGVMRLIGFIEETHGIKVPPQDMVIENFVSVQAMAQYITSKKD